MEVTRAFPGITFPYEVGDYIRARTKDEDALAGTCLIMPSRNDCR